MKIGDRVRIRKDSGWHDTCEHVNPHNDVVGMVINVRDGLGLSVQVQWVGHTNVYNQDDLEMEETHFTYTMSKHRMV